MIYHDERGLPVDKDRDAADSAVRMSILTSVDFAPATIDGLKILSYVQDGLIYRHPYQAPACNPNSTTRDQMVPVMAALWRIELTKEARSVFWATLKRFFFSQSSERDWPGSTKHIYPHQFYKDSKPDVTTLPMKWNWKTFKFETTLISNEETSVEYKYFDHSDYLAPDVVWHFILCARLWYAYWFAILGYPWLYLSIHFHAQGRHREHNQVILQSIVAGAFFVRLFKKKVPRYREEILAYWQSRGEEEYANLILEFLNKDVYKV